MLKIIKRFLDLLTKSQRKRFYILQIFVIFMAIVEVFSIASIIPFMSLVGDPSILKQKNIFAEMYHISGISSESQFIFLLGVLILSIQIVSAIISMSTVWALSMFGNKIGAEISDRLYRHYIKQSWLFHAYASSAQLTKNIATEVIRITNGLLLPVLFLVSRTILALLICVFIFIYNPLVSLFGIIIFALSYFSLFRIVRARLELNGKSITRVNEDRFRLMNEGFGGIKEILLLGRDSDFIERFTKTGSTLAKSLGINTALSNAPRYVMELVAFGSIIALILFLTATNNNNIGSILPVLSVFALAGFKLLPALHQIYYNVSILRSELAAYDSIEQDLVDSLKNQPISFSQSQDLLIPNKAISMENISFKYPNKSELALSGINLSIPANAFIGIVGRSGSGKSTLIDILLGLIEPQTGHLKIDDIKINPENRRQWSNAIGFVAQNIFLSEGSIMENIAFGIPRDQIDLNQITQAIKLAHLSDLIESLEDGMLTKVGERGIQLSGGQRQRIGIARALYHKAEVLVFDEATSSLDGVSEKMIMQSINSLSSKKTIILVAHRLKTVQNCDNIFFLENGKIIDQGSFQELIKNNELFKTMANYA